jgi:hypothetical protein
LKPTTPLFALSSMKPVLGEMEWSLRRCSTSLLSHLNRDYLVLLGGDH